MEGKYIERLNLISCFSSKEASFVKDMHDCEERTPIRQCRKSERLHPGPLLQGGGGTSSVCDRESQIKRGENPSPQPSA